MEIKIGIDADGVLYDYVGQCAEYVNLITGKNVSHSSCYSYDALHSWGVKNLQPAVDDYFAKPGTVLSMPLIDGAQWMVDSLFSTFGFDKVCVVTACPPSWHVDRAAAIARDFGLGEDMICFTLDKSHANINVLIDDWHGNFIGNDFESILIDRPWNQDGHCDFRAFCYSDVVSYLQMNKNNLRSNREIDRLRAHVEHLKSERDEYRSRLSSHTTSR